MEMIDRYNEIKNAYNKSSERPFLCEESIFLNEDNYSHYIDLYTKLVNEGLDLILPSNWNLLDWCINHGDYNQCSKLISLYKPTTVISVDLDINPHLVLLLKAKLNVRLILPPCENLISPRSVMNVIENMKHYNDDVLEVPLCDECKLLRQYLELFNIPFTLGYDYYNTTILNSTSVISRSYSNNEISCMNHEDLTYLLINAINEGRYRLANTICNAGSFSITNDDITTLIGCDTLFELVESRVDISVDDIQSIFVKLVNMDYDLEFCNRPTVSKYWNSIDVESITNTRALDLLMIRCVINVPEFNNIVESLDEYKTSKEYIDRITLCSRVYSYSSMIKFNNVIKLIGMLDRFDGDISEKRAVNNSIMSLIISLLSDGLIDVKGYKNTHPYIDFLIE